MRTFVRMMCFAVCSIAAVGFVFDSYAETPATPDLGYKLQLKFRYWLSDLSAKTSEITDIRGRQIPLEDELGVDTSDMPEGQLIWRITPRHSLKLAYTEINADGDEFVARQVRLGDNEEFVPIFSRVTADLGVKYGRIGWRYAIVNTLEEKLRLETMLDAAIFSIKADYAAYPLGLIRTNSDDFSLTAGLPLAGLAVTWTPAKWFSLFGECGGMTGGQYGYIVDTEAGLRFTPWRYTSIEAGYRYLTIKGEVDDDEAKVTVDGPFAGISFQF